METRELRDLLAHMAWADGLIWVSVLGVASADREPRLRQLLHHLHSVQWAHLQIWRGESVQIPDVASFDQAHLRCRGGWRAGRLGFIWDSASAPS